MKRDYLDRSVGNIVKAMAQPHRFRSRRIFRPFVAIWLSHIGRIERGFHLQDDGRDPP